LIFGRGAEEAEELKKHNIPYEYIPGITAMSGAASYTGIPLTHRKISSNILITTGNFTKEKNVEFREKFYKYLGEFDGTIAIYMGGENLKEIAKYLLNHGKKESTPVAVVFNASLPNQKIYTTTLGESVKTDIVIREPALVLIGNVVSLHPMLDWHKTKPLLNKLFIITRPIENSLTLNTALLDAGATTFLFPFIKYHPLDIPPSQIKKIPRFSWIIFKSQFAVQVFFETLSRNKLDIRYLKNAKIAAIGNTTATKLKERGIIPDLIPPYYNTASLGKTITNKLSPSDTVLICSADIRNKSLENTLKEKNIRYKLLTLYKILPVPDNIVLQKWLELATLLNSFSQVNIIFTSSQTV
ncbi:MAG: uroporphyrinogen-III synthase, partial [Planctomycetota bacterium]